MAGRLIECVPNFSEGRDAGKVHAIRDAIASAPGVLVLRTDLDADHNRSVITFAGAPEAVADAALRGIAKAVDLIDLRRHTGVHPRIGAADVVPFVPLEGVTLEDCAAIARRTGEEVWKRLGVPVYFYEAAARLPERAPLENIRRGGFEDPQLAPDLGGPQLHPSAGACVLGARKLLIAFNVNLNTTDVAIARSIARKVRASSGGLPFVKAIGVPLASRNLTQIAMNLTDFERTPLHRAFEAVRAEAEAHGVSIAGGQIVGLIPRKALEQAAARYLECENFDGSLVLENRLSSARPEAEIEGLLAELAGPKSPKGGGSAAAGAGAMAAALGSKLCRFAGIPDCFEEPRAFFRQAVERDAAAFQATITSGPQALAAAATVPIEVAEAARSLIDALKVLEIPAKLASDRQSALALAEAARQGAIATARANLTLMESSSEKSALEKRLRAIE